MSHGGLRHTEAIQCQRALRVDFSTAQAYVLPVCIGWHLPRDAFQVSERVVQTSYYSLAASKLGIWPTMTGRSVCCVQGSLWWVLSADVFSHRTLSGGRPAQLPVLSEPCCSPLDAHSAMFGGLLFKLSICREWSSIFVDI